MISFSGSSLLFHFLLSSFFLQWTRRAVLCQLGDHTHSPPSPVPMSLHNSHLSPSQSDSTNDSSDNLLDTNFTDFSVFLAADKLMQLSGRGKNSSNSSHNIQKLISLNGITKQQTRRDTSNVPSDVDSNSIDESSVEGESTNSKEELPLHSCAPGELGTCNSSVPETESDNTSTNPSTQSDDRSKASNDHPSDTNTNKMEGLTNCRPINSNTRNSSTEDCSSQSAEQSKDQTTASSEGVSNGQILECKGVDVNVNGETMREGEMKEASKSEGTVSAKEEVMELGSADEIESGNEMDEDGHPQGYEPGFGE